MFVVLVCVIVRGLWPTVVVFKVLYKYIWKTLLHHFTKSLCGIYSLAFYYHEAKKMGALGHLLAVVCWLSINGTEG